MKHCVSIGFTLLATALAQTPTAEPPHTPVHIASAARLIGITNTDFATGRLAAKSDDVVERRYTLTFLVNDPPSSYFFKLTKAMQPLKAYNLGQSYFAITCPSGQQVYSNLSEANQAELLSKEQYTLDFAALCGVKSFKAADKVILLEQFKLK